MLGAVVDKYTRHLGSPEQKDLTYPQGVSETSWESRHLSWFWEDEEVSDKERRPGRRFQGELEQKHERRHSFGSWKQGMIRSQARGVGRGQSETTSLPCWSLPTRSVWRPWNDAHTSGVWPDLYFGETPGWGWWGPDARNWERNGKENNRLKPYEEWEEGSLFLAEWNLLLVYQWYKKQGQRSIWIGWGGPFCDLWPSLELQAVGGWQAADVETGRGHRGRGQGDGNHYYSEGREHLEGGAIIRGTVSSTSSVSRERNHGEHQPWKEGTLRIAFRKAGSQKMQEDRDKF